MTRLCIAAGGTGGHIFPAVAFAEWILSHEPGVSISFVCGSRPMEKEMYASRGFVPLCLPLSGSPFGAPGFVACLRRWKETVSSWFFFRNFLREEECDCCVLFGGYVSFIPLLACHIRGIPTVVHEQNGAAGKITRLASKLGKTVASGWNVCRPLKPGRFVSTGIPVRAFEQKKRGDAWNRLTKGKPFPKNNIIGVLGGSLMSERLIQLLGCVVQDMESQKLTYLLLGEPNDRIRDDFFTQHPENAVFLGRQWDMSDFYSVIDAAVARGGASTLSELMAWKIPSVIIPWREAADNHQEMNAECFVNMAAGEMWREDDPLDDLRDKILRVLRNINEHEKRFSEGDESERLWRLISSSTGREINYRG